MSWAFSSIAKPFTGSAFKAGNNIPFPCHMLNEIMVRKLCPSYGYKVQDLVLKKIIHLVLGEDLVYTNNWYSNLFLNQSPPKHYPVARKLFWYFNLNLCVVKAC